MGEQVVRPYIIGKRGLSSHGAVLFIVAIALEVYGARAATSRQCFDFVSGDKSDCIPCKGWKDCDYADGLTCEPGIANKSLSPWGSDAGCMCYPWFGMGQYNDTNGLTCRVGEGRNQANKEAAKVCHIILLVGSSLAIVGSLGIFLGQGALVVSLLRWKVLNPENVVGQTVIMNQIGFFLILGTATGYFLTTIGVDRTLYFENKLKGTLVGLGSSLCVSGLLNVSVLWIDLAKSSRHMKKRQTKGDRLGKLKYFLRGLGLFQLIMTTALLTIGWTTAAAMLCFPFILGIMVSYIIGAWWLSSLMLGPSKDKKDKSSKKTSTAVANIKSCAIGVAVGCAIQLAGGCLYVTSGGDPTFANSYMSIAGVMLMLVGLVLQEIPAVIYLRWSQRKYIGVQPGGEAGVSSVGDSSTGGSEVETTSDQRGSHHASR